MFAAQTEVNASVDVIQRKAPYNPNGPIMFNENYSHVAFVYHT